MRLASAKLIVGGIGRRLNPVWSGQRDAKPGRPETAPRFRFGCPASAP
jgi:hypothetical protein